MAFDEEDGAGIVQEFFACMDRVAQDFTAAFYALPDGAFDALMQCAISALSLQERYSLVAAVEVGEEEEGRISLRSSRRRCEPATGELGGMPHVARRTRPWEGRTGIVFPSMGAADGELSVKANRIAL
jgi:hypothetical protein